jgi:ATP-binding cassette subfamily F protein uup
VRTDRYDERLSYKERREYEQLERRLPELEERVSDLTAELEGAGSDWQEASRLSGLLERARTELEAAEERWLELSDRA